MVGCQNSEDDTLPCTNSTAGPARPVTDSTATVSRSVGTRSAVTPGSSVLIKPLLWRERHAREPGHERIRTSGPAAALAVLRFGLIPGTARRRAPGCARARYRS